MEQVIFKRQMMVLFILLLMNIYLGTIIFYFLFFPEKVVFLNVGQGDAELIATRAGNILIDAGPNNSLLFALSKVLPFYERTIDLVIISHPNKDHYNGLFELLDKYQVRAVILNNYTYPSSSFQKLLKELQKQKILLIEGEKNLRVRWQKEDVSNRLLVIYPFQNETFSLEANSSCLVLDLLFHHYQFLFPGDISSSQEKKIIETFQFPSSSLNILKVAHHGSRYSSSALFLKAFHPQIAILEVGENNYHQPHQETLSRLQQIGAQIFRTDINGNIQFIFKNKHFKIQIENH